MVNLEVPHFSTAAPLGATRRTVQPPFTAVFGLVSPATYRKKNFSRHCRKSVSREADTCFCKWQMISSTVGAGVGDASAFMCVRVSFRFWFWCEDTKKPVRFRSRALGSVKVIRIQVCRPRGSSCSRSRRRPSRAAPGLRTRARTQSGAHDVSVEPVGGHAVSSFLVSEGRTGSGAEEGGRWELRPSSLNYYQKPRPKRLRRSDEPADGEGNLVVEAAALNRQQSAPENAAPCHELVTNFQK